MCHWCLLLQMCFLQGWLVGARLDVSVLGSRAHKAILEGQMVGTQRHKSPGIPFG